jgi:hypothetical protein
MLRGKNLVKIRGGVLALAVPAVLPGAIMEVVPTLIPVAAICAAIGTHREQGAVEVAEIQEEEEGQTRSGIPGGNNHLIATTGQDAPLLAEHTIAAPVGTRGAIVREAGAPPRSVRVLRRGPRPVLAGLSPCRA